MNAIPEALSLALCGLRLGGIRYLERVGSTMDEAAAWLAESAPHWALVVAEEQTAGRGRLGRRWFTAPRASLAFSLILRRVSTAQLALLTGSAALAVCEALEERYALRPQIKWPNDVLLGGRKVCGVLAEAHWQGERLSGVVLGIGVNLTRPALPSGQDLLFPATALQEHVSYSAAELERDRFPFLAHILQRLSVWLPRLNEPAFLQSWEERLAYRHQPVQVLRRVEDASSLIAEGIVEGLGPCGELLLRLSSGERRAVGLGEIRVRPSTVGGASDVH